MRNDNYKYMTLKFTKDEHATIENLIDAMEEKTHVRLSKHAFVKMLLEWGIPEVKSGLLYSA
jgi:hypothetical protein